MLTEPFYPNSHQHGTTPLHHCAMVGYSYFVERILSTPGIDVNIRDMVSSFTGCYKCMQSCTCGIGLLKALVNKLICVDV